MREVHQHGGDLVHLDLETLEARRYVETMEPGALGVANRNIGELYT